MAINGINSYSMGFYNYQSAINNVRLSQALAKNPKLSQAVSSITSATSRSSSLQSSVGFVKQYNSSMSSLMNAANSLKTTNKTGAMSDLAVTSSNKSVATATEKLPARSAKSYQLNVMQLAQKQTNVSSGVKASAKADTNMNFSVGNGINTVNVQVSAKNNSGNAKTNLEMLNEAAFKINNSKSNVTASVIQKDGIASLQLESKSTGEGNAFSVSGELGAAAGAENVQTEAANAKYSVTTDGVTTQHESYTNDISLDYTRIDVELKGIGETTIASDVDTDKVGAALGDLVDAYNSSLKLLNDNYDRGTGVDRQLRSLVAGLGSEQSLNQLGITVNKDATLNFDKSTFEKNMKENPSLTKNIISGVGGVADTAFNKASSAMSVNSGSLINGDLSSAQTSSITNPYNVFSMYSRSGAYNMSNYYAVGLMMNYLV